MRWGAQVEQACFEVQGLTDAEWSFFVLGWSGPGQVTRELVIELLEAGDTDSELTLRNVDAAQLLARARVLR